MKDALQKFGCLKISSRLAQSGRSVGQLSFAVTMDGGRNGMKTRGRSCETKATVAAVKRGRGNSVETDRATENVLPRLTYRNHARQIVKTTGNPLFHDCPVLQW